MNIHIWGQVRTGTNWFADACKANYKTEVNRNANGLKHQFLSDLEHTEGKSLGQTLWRRIEDNFCDDLHIVMYKHEPNWLHSMTRNRAKKNGADWFYDVYGKHTEEQLLRHYRTYYQQWLEFNIPNKIILYYEEALVNFEEVIDTISVRFNLPLKGDITRPKIGSTSQSEDLTEERVQMYIKNYQDSLDEQK